jgi:hypothetical protein
MKITGEKFQFILENVNVANFFCCSALIVIPILFYLVPYTNFDSFSYFVYKIFLLQPIMKTITAYTQNPSDLEVFKFSKKHLFTYRYFERR